MITETQVDAAMAVVPDRHLGAPGLWEPGIEREVMRKALEESEARCERGHIADPVAISLTRANWLLLAGWIIGGLQAGAEDAPVFIEVLLDAVDNL